MEQGGKEVEGRGRREERRKKEEKDEIKYGKSKDGDKRARKYKRWRDRESEG